MEFDAKSPNGTAARHRRYM